MKLSICLATVLGIAAAAPAKADFLLAPSAPPTFSTAGASSGPVNIAVPPRRRPPSLPAVEGFGEAVPVHVAARQIVPEGISVVFGDGVDRELPVDWRGGRPWNLVLADAIKPLGFKVSRTATRSASPADLQLRHSRRSPPPWWDHGGANARLVPQCGCRLAAGA